MKRFIFGFCMILLSFGLYACGKTTKKVTKKEPAVSSLPAASAEVSSGSAVQSTEPPRISADGAFSMAENLLKTMTLEQKVAQMFMVELNQLDKNRTKDGTKYKITPQMRDNLAKYSVGGIFLSKSNFSSVKKTKKLISDLQSCVSGSSLYVAVEEEGGGEYSFSAQIPALKDTGFISPWEMGSNMTNEQVYETGKTIGNELSPIGINMNFGPVADISDESNKEYAVRCFSDDSGLVSDMVSSIVQGMHDGNIGSALKYFPGIGNVPGEVTEDILENSDSLMTLRNHNFTTYSAGIEAGTDAVMVSNVSFQKITMKKIPAFMSNEIVTSLLREELDFDGVIMTPPLDENVIKKNYSTEFVVTEAVKAGCDMIILPDKLKEGYEGLLSAVQSEEISEKVINAAVLRILQNKILRGILVLEQ